jgi:transcriptional regulator with XRE-family HTH domain
MTVLRKGWNDAGGTAVVCAKETGQGTAVLPTGGKVLGVPVTEVARKVGVNRSVIFRLEESEARQSITLRSMTRIAQALDCKMVYALVPRDGGTLEEMADRRKWGKYFGVGD